MTDEGRELLPSKLRDVDQRLDLDGNVTVVTRSASDGLALVSHIQVEEKDRIPTCSFDLTAESDARAWLVVALRPYNPEGVSFVHDVALQPENLGWRIDDRRIVEFETPAERVQFSNYRTGDVYHRVCEPTTRGSIHCNVGMASAAALFRVDSGTPRQVRVTVPLARRSVKPAQRSACTNWRDAVGGCAHLRIPDARSQFLYEAAVRSLILHSPGEVYPGPYTYKRFWYRDATFILHALLCIGLVQRVERALDKFPAGQTTAGFFHSQDGEWDSNGEVLWIFNRFCELTGCAPKRSWRRANSPWRSLDKGEAPV